MESSAFPNRSASKSQKEQRPVREQSPLEKALRKCCEDNGFEPRQFFHTLRVAITGKKIGPDLFASMEILGRETCLRRIAAAIKKLEIPS